MRMGQNRRLWRCLRLLANHSGLGAHAGGNETRRDVATEERKGVCWKPPLTVVLLAPPPISNC